MAYENLLRRRGRNASRRGPLPSFDYSNIIGVNFADSIYTMPANQSPFGQDADFGNPIGSIKKRAGFESLITSLGTSKMLGLHGWPHSTGDKLLAAWGKNLYLLSGNSGSVAKSSQADWEAGTLTDVEATSSAGDIKLTKGTDFSEADTLTADFDGTHSSTEAKDNSVKLVAGTSYSAVCSGGSVVQYGFDLDTLSNIFDNNESTFGYSLTSFSSDTYIGYDFGPSVTRHIRRIRIKNASYAQRPSSVKLQRFDNWYGWLDVQTLTFGTYDADQTFDIAASGASRLWRIMSLSASTVYQWVIYEIEMMEMAAYVASGTYTHPVQDPSGAVVCKTSAITFNKTTPAGTGVTVEVSIDGGDTWIAKNSGDSIFAVGADLTDKTVQWRALLTNTSVSDTPSLDDVTVEVTSGYSATGNWISPVYDLVNTPLSSLLTFTIVTPANTTVTAYARGSSNNTVFGDWLEVLTSGDSIPLQRYIEVKFVLTTTDIAATPTVSGFVISHSSSYTTPNKLDISPLGRVSDYLTGNRVRFCNYEDWLLMADGLRPFMAYITTTTQEADTAQAGGASTITLKAGASAVNNFYNNAFVTITGGTGEGQTRWISGYVGATKVATVSTAWDTQPDATSTYSIGSAVKVRNLGVDPPTVAPSGADSGVSGSPNGAYLLKVTYVNADDVESNAGDASATVTVSSKKITWTIPVDSSTGNTTAKRRLYRTAAGGSVYKYLAEVADNTTTTYTDNTADVALGSLMLDNNNIPPLACTLLYQFTSYVFYVDGYDVWFSKAGSPDQVPNITGDIQQMAFPGRVNSIDANPIALVISGDDFDATITSNTGFIFDSDPTVDTTTTKVIDNNGALNAEASVVCLSPALGSTLIRNTNIGLRSTRPGLQDNSMESIPVSRAIQPYYERSINRDQAAAAFFNSYYLYSFEHQPADGSASEYLTFAYDLRTEQWYGPWKFGMACYTVVDNVLYAGDAAAGKIYRMFTGNDDAGTAINMVVDLPMRAPGGEAGSCKFKDVLLIVSSESDTTSTVLKIKVDEREATISIGELTPTFTGDVRPGHNFIRTKKYRIPLPAGHTYSVRVEDESVNPLEILKITTEYEVLPLSK